MKIVYWVWVNDKGQIIGSHHKKDGIKYLFNPVDRAMLHRVQCVGEFKRKRK